MHICIFAHLSHRDEKDSAAMEAGEMCGGRHSFGRRARERMSDDVQMSQVLVVHWIRPRELIRLTSETTFAERQIHTCES